MLKLIDELYLGTAAPASGGGGDINNQDKTITENGVYTADAGYTGLGTVTVDVPSAATATILVDNLTGSNLDVGQLTLISPVVCGDENDTSVILVTNGNYGYGVVSADGQYVYAKYSNNSQVQQYNVIAGTTTSVGSSFSCSGTFQQNLFKYSEDGTIYYTSFYQSSYITTGESSFGANLGDLKYVGGNYFYDTTTGKFYRIKNGVTEKTYTPDFTSFYNYGSNGFLDFQYNNGYIYYCSGQYTKKRFIIDDANDVMTTDNNWEVTLTGYYPMYAITGDGKYILITGDAVATKGVRFLEITNTGANLITDCISFAPDLVEFYANTDAYFSYNVLGDILSVALGSKAYTFSYADARFYKVLALNLGYPIYAVTASSDGTVISINAKSNHSIIACALNNKYEQDYHVYNNALAYSAEVLSAKVSSNSADGTKATVQILKPEISNINITWE